MCIRDRVGVEELMGQVGVRGMVLNGIKAGFDRSLGGGAEFIYAPFVILS